MKVVLCMLALLAVASTASATFAPWYHQVLFKNKCYVPGCDECVDFKPYTCAKCSDGYALLSDNTCGCAAGFGSYVQPPTAGYPYYPPHSCPSWTLSKSGTITKSTVRSTAANGRPGPAVSLKTWYINKPGFCTQTYYPTKTCQGSIPVSSVGYCKCFACPAGTSSTGGPISSMGAGCTPSGQPVSRCVQAPPAITNANPWNPAKCKNLRPNKFCTTTCAAGFQPQTPGSSLTAKCTAGGVWQLNGACVASAAACKGSPNAGPNANAFTDCADGSDGKTCTSTCAAGFDGAVTATCNAATGSWVVSNTCKAAAATCSGSPDSANADFSACADLKAGQTCDGVCANGDSITATCGNNGKYTITGECAAGAACPGTPTAPEGANDFTENQNGAPCTDGAVEDACVAECADGSGTTVDAVCQADGAGWSVSGTCDGGGGGGGDFAACEDLPEDATASNANAWPEECAGTADGEVCATTCADGFNADGSIAEAYCTAGVWTNNVECIPAKRKDTRPGP